MDSSPLGPSTSGGMNPEHVGRVRVLVIGNTGMASRGPTRTPPARTARGPDQGCGKTSLSHFLATGEVLKAAQTTVGCNVFAKLVEYPEDTSVDGTKQNHRLYFVELWDVGIDLSPEQRGGIA
ncbi:unnamed protein product [Ostreobium quekettii]|uniref:Uncharacterized protein n=1 Tax=Ostreobium quekettii TaxID=121088 RepID=A0A8S1IQF1_9CHLO|nr:unnamed protein product [Ostreobium quekettii]